MGDEMQVDFPLDEGILVRLEEAMDPELNRGVSRLADELQRITREKASGQGFFYSNHDVIKALISEVRRLREEVRVTA